MKPPVTDELWAADTIDRARASLDSRCVGANDGGRDVGPHPTDTGKPGRKHHRLVDGEGLPPPAREAARRAGGRRPPLPRRLRPAWGHAPDRAEGDRIEAPSVLKS